MNILALDTGSECACVALMLNDKLCYEVSRVDKKSHSVYLLPMIQTMLGITKAKLEEIDYFACAIGPGSFTGIRIGITTIKAFAQCLDKPCVPIDGLYAMAKNFATKNTLCFAIEDARRERVFVSGVIGDEAIMDSCVMEISKLIEMANEYKDKGNEVLFVGGGATVYKDCLDGLEGFEVKCNQYSKGSYLIEAAKEKIQKGEVLNAFTLMPNYVLPSQAKKLSSQNQEKILLKKISHE